MKIPQRCLFTGSLACEPDACRGGDVNFELREVVEFDQTGGIEVLHLFPVTVCAKGELGERVLDELQRGDRVLISCERTALEAPRAVEMEAYELLSRDPQKNTVMPKVWAVAEGSPFEPTTL